MFNCKLVVCISVRPYKTAPETLRRFVAYIHDEGETTKVRSLLEAGHRRSDDLGSMESSDEKVLIIKEICKF